jgi:hypothetical protein
MAKNLFDLAPAGEYNWWCCYFLAQKISHSFVVKIKIQLEEVVDQNQTLNREID